MKPTFRDFEIQAISIMVAGSISEELATKLTSHRGKWNYDYTGSGYFLTIREDWIPKERIVLSEPYVAGRVGVVESGFVGFIDGNEFVLECHACSEVGIPEDFREMNVEILNSNEEK